MIILGLLLVVLGIFNCRGNICTIHWYNRRKVSEQDRPAYGKWMGAGTIVCGGGLIAGGIMRHFLPEHIWSIPLLAAIILGLAFMLYAQIKYNRGIF